MSTNMQIDNPTSHSSLMVKLGSQHGSHKKGFEKYVKKLSKSNQISV